MKKKIQGQKYFFLGLNTYTSSEYVHKKANLFPLTIAESTLNPMCALIFFPSPFKVRHIDS